MKNKDDLKKYLEIIRNNQANILVIGDIMLDRYLYGKVERISPEAPIPVVHIQNEDFKAGGAANVALNIANCNKNVHLIGVIGKDNHGDKLLSIINNKIGNSKYIIIDPNRESTSKTRIIANKQQQIVRLDRESTDYISKDIQANIIQIINDSIKNNKYSAIVISDYNKGVLRSEVADNIMKNGLENQIPILIDSKLKHYKQYSMATLIKPNQKECSLLLGINNDNNLWNNKKYIKEKLINLKNDLQIKEIVVTRGEYGLYYISNNEEMIHLDAQPHSVYDVTGAGDVMIAWLASAKACNIDTYTACYLANTAASISVTHVGSTSVGIDDVGDFYGKS